MYDKIAILISSYNGEKYIRSQIESIINQTYPNWDIYIRDDGSTDNTIEEINKLISIDSRIHLLKDKISHRGVKDSFLWLLYNVSANYYMFCDQDDVWLPFKIEKSLSLIKDIESQHNNSPCLIVTDLTTVNDNLDIIEPSLWKYLGIDKLVLHPSFLSVAPMYTGCTMLFNKIAKQSVLNGADSKYIIHDQLVALNVYKNGGYIRALHTPTILYRQHGNNVIGAQLNHRSRSFIDNLSQTIRATFTYYKSIQPILHINPINYYIKKIIRIVYF